MTIEVKKELNFYDLRDNCWSGAIDTLKRISDEDKQEELMGLLNEMFLEETPDLTDINDYLWFDSDDIYECLGITDEEE